MSDLTRIRKWPNTCDEEVSRRGEAQPCEKPAVAVRLDFNHSSDGDPYPVCSNHARGPMVPLSELLSGPPRQYHVDWPTSGGGDPL